MLLALMPMGSEGGAAGAADAADAADALVAAGGRLRNIRQRGPYACRPYRLTQSWCLQGFPVRGADIASTSAIVIILIVEPVVSVAPAAPLTLLRPRHSLTCGCAKSWPCGVCRSLMQPVIVQRLLHARLNLWGSGRPVFGLHAIWMQLEFTHFGKQPPGMNVCASSPRTQFLVWHSLRQLKGSYSCFFAPLRQCLMMQNRMSSMRMRSL